MVTVWKYERRFDVFSEVILGQLLKHFVENDVFVSEDLGLVFVGLTKLGT